MSEFQKQLEIMENGAAFARDILKELFEVTGDTLVHKYSGEVYSSLD